MSQNKSQDKSKETTASAKAITESVAKPTQPPGNRSLQCSAILPPDQENRALKDRIAAAINAAKKAKLPPRQENRDSKGKGKSSSK